MTREAHISVVRKWPNSIFPSYGFRIQTDKTTNRKKITVVETNSPADHAGLKVDDVIYEINNESVKGMSHKQVCDLVRQGHDSVILFAMDADTEQWCITNKLQIHSAMTELTVSKKETPRSPPPDIVDDLRRQSMQIGTHNAQTSSGAVEQKMKAPDNLKSPVLATVRKWPSHFNGYGFQLQTPKTGATGTFIGNVEPHSPASLAGLVKGQKIIEVNAVNIANENHSQVVTRIKQGGNCVTFLLCDPDTVEWCRKHEVVLKRTMKELEVEHHQTPTIAPPEVLKALGFTDRLKNVSEESSGSEHSASVTAMTHDEPEPAMQAKREEEEEEVITAEQRVAEEVAVNSVILAVASEEVEEAGRTDTHHHHDEASDGDDEQNEPLPPPPLEQAAILAMHHRLDLTEKRDSIDDPVRAQQYEMGRGDESSRSGSESGYHHPDMRVEHRLDVDDIVGEPPLAPASPPTPPPHYDQTVVDEETVKLENITRRGTQYDVLQQVLTTFPPPSAHRPPPPIDEEGNAPPPSGGATTTIHISDRYEPPVQNGYDKSPTDDRRTEPVYSKPKGSVLRGRGTQDSRIVSGDDKFGMSASDYKATLLGRRQEQRKQVRQLSVEERVKRFSQL